MRLIFNAPDNSAFAVSLRDLTGTTVATLPLNSGTAASPGDGYYQIVSKYFQSPSPEPFYNMYVRAPAALADPLNYDILVVHQSLRTNVADSTPMVVPLRRANYMLTVMVTGSGHVMSTPAGILCGTAPSGAALTACSHDFGPAQVQVSLAPNSNDPNTTRFLGWAGNCTPNVQTCVLTLFGRPATANATFVARGSSQTASACPAAPLVAGFSWIDVPDCATGNIAGHPTITHPAACDAGGYFCCEDADGTHPGDARCGGRFESPADCGRDAPRGRLIQPGGCYAVSP